MDQQKITPVVLSPAASPDSDSARKRKLACTGKEDCSPMMTLSTPARTGPTRAMSDPQILFPVVATTPKDFRVLSSESLYKRRKVQTETGETVAVNILPSPASGKYREAISDLRSPISLANKGFTICDSPGNGGVMTPLNLTSNRCDLFDDGSIGKFLNARRLGRRVSQVPSSKSLFPLTPGRKKNSYQSPSVGLESPVPGVSNAMASINTSLGNSKSPTTPERSLLATPNKNLSVTPLCTRIATNMNISSPLPRHQGTPLAGTTTKGTQYDSAIKKSLRNPQLVGDFSKIHLLPTINGKNRDIPSISPSTMVKVLNGEYQEESFLILDCRYPYEYEGGHIKGAKNFYTKKELAKKLFPSTLDLNSGSRTILIFHCEFSSERGPGMYRFVRTKDRKMNAANYPYLFYPEMYVLEGGYRAFYAAHKELCDPQAYKTMRDEENTRDLVNFRAECKAEKKDQSTKPYEAGVVGKLEFTMTPKP